MANGKWQMPDAKWQTANKMPLVWQNEPAVGGCSRRQRTAAFCQPTRRRCIRLTTRRLLWSTLDTTTWSLAPDTFTETDQQKQVQQSQTNHKTISDWDEMTNVKQKRIKSQCQLVQVPWNSRRNEMTNGKRTTKAKPASVNRNAQCSTPQSSWNAQNAKCQMHTHVDNCQMRNCQKRRQMHEVSSAKYWLGKAKILKQTHFCVNSKSWGNSISALELNDVASWCGLVNTQILHL